MSTIAEKPAREDRRRELLDAAFAEFAAKGYAGASMEAIARRARASKETLYAWFENKESLFNTLLASRLEGIVSRVAAAAREDPSPAHVLPVIAEHVVRLTLTILPLTQAMGAGEPGEKAARLMGETIAEERRQFAAYLARRRDEGDLAFDDDPLEIANLFVALAEGQFGLRLGLGLLAEVTDKMIEAHARRVARIFLHGLAPR